MASQKAPPTPVALRLQRQLKLLKTLTLDSRHLDQYGALEARMSVSIITGIGYGKASYILIPLDTLRHLLQIIVIRLVDVAKVADLVTWLESRQGRRAPIDNAIDPRKRRHESGRRYVVPQGFLGSGSLRFGGRGDVFWEASEVLVYPLLDGVHEVLVVVPEMDDAGPGGAYFIKLLEALQSALSYGQAYFARRRCQPWGIHRVSRGAYSCPRHASKLLDSLPSPQHRLFTYRIEDPTKGPELRLHVGFLLLELCNGPLNSRAILGAGGSRPRGYRRCMKVVHFQRQSHYLGASLGMRAVELKLEPRSVGVHVGGESGVMRGSTSSRHGGGT